VPAAQYHIQQPLGIVIVSPLRAAGYKKSKLTHAPQFGIGTALMFISYETFYSTRFFATIAVVSVNWLIL
ncbi:MFS transporter, partial [Francisella tularensis subsp. holarctica]|nr:MFS transporter [Francisella tularensis subsp. holarctica]